MEHEKDQTNINPVFGSWHEPLTASDAVVKALAC